MTTKPQLHNERRKPMSEHTPGPWYCSHQDPWATKALIFNDQQTGKKACLLKLIATVEVSNVNIPDYEGLANAHLMVRAPEMEQLLRQLVRILDAADGNLPLYSQQGQGMDGISERENYRDIAQKARNLLKTMSKQPE